MLNPFPTEQGNREEIDVALLSMSKIYQIDHQTFFKIAV